MQHKNCRGTYVSGGCLQCFPWMEHKRHTHREKKKDRDRHTHTNKIKCRSGEERGSMELETKREPNYHQLTPRQPQGEGKRSQGLWRRLWRWTLRDGVGCRGAGIWEQQDVWGWAVVLSTSAEAEAGRLKSCTAHRLLKACTEAG